MSMVGKFVKVKDSMTILTGKVYEKELSLVDRKPIYWVDFYWPNSSSIMHWGGWYKKKDMILITEKEAKKKPSNRPCAIPGIIKEQRT